MRSRPAIEIGLTSEKGEDCRIDFPPKVDIGREACPEHQRLCLDTQRAGTDNASRIRRVVPNLTSQPTSRPPAPHAGRIARHLSPKLIRHLKLIKESSRALRLSVVFLHCLSRSRIGHARPSRRMQRLHVVLTRRRVDGCHINKTFACLAKKM